MVKEIFKRLPPIDKPFLASVILLTVIGFFIFSSASLGLLTREGPRFEIVAMKQVFGLVLGILAFIVASRLSYRFWRKWAMVILIASIALNFLVFVPGLSLGHGGAVRWIDLGIITIQPSEFLKIAFIIYFAAWISHFKEKIHLAKYGIVPYLIIVGILASVLYLQSDTDTLAVISVTGLIMLYMGGGKKRHVAILCGIIALGLSFIIFTKPYIVQRLKIYFNPSADLSGAGYQINQSLIGIGSGQIVGRGFGQSVQKFGTLPEPIGDSIFAVWAEEFGFIGSVSLVALFVFFLATALRIALKVKDRFGGLTVAGIAILIVVESLVNIAAMLGLLPLSGMPLLFVSHGGTALIMTLGAAGIIAGVSRHVHDTE
jgi:cell division protein FtsW